ncbi:MAG: hypothetical protein ACJ79H_17525 [Myxococcales bacterium]
MTETVEQRAERIFARMEADYGPGDRLFAAVICDGCGLTVVATTPASVARLIADWTLGAAGESNDLCASCAKDGPPTSEPVAWEAQYGSTRRLDDGEHTSWSPWFRGPNRHMVESCPAHIRLHLGRNTPARLVPIRPPGERDGA